MRGLGELERVVMETLWASAVPMTARDVARELADRDLAYTTVMTVLDRLAKKGLVLRERSGRAWQYVPAESQDGYVAELMRSALDLTGNRPAALSRFVQSVSPDEADALRKVLDELDADRR